MLIMINMWSSVRENLIMWKYVIGSPGKYINKWKSNILDIAFTHVHAIRSYI